MGKTYAKKLRRLILIFFSCCSNLACVFSVQNQNCRGRLYKSMYLLHDFLEKVKAFMIYVSKEVPSMLMFTRLLCIYTACIIQRI